jgi:hypothetical protein
VRYGVLPVEIDLAGIRIRDGGKGAEVEPAAINVERLLGPGLTEDVRPVRFEIAVGELNDCLRSGALVVNQGVSGDVASKRT